MKKQQRRKIQIGIDVGTATTRVLVSEIENTNLPKVIGTGIAESLGVKHGYVNDPYQTAESIKRAVTKAEQSSGVSIKKALVSIGGISLQKELVVGNAIISRADKQITVLDIDNALDDAERNLVLQNRKVLHRIPIAYRIDGEEVHGNPVGMHGLKLEVKVMLVTCITQHLENLITAVTEAGIQVIDVIAGPIAEATLLLTEKQKSVGCGLVNIGSETVSIVVYENGLPITLHVFGIGATDITKDIALGFKIPYDEAEGVKIGSMMMDIPKRKLDEIIQARLTDIFELVDGHLKKIKRSKLLPAGIIITGGGSQFSYIEEAARETLNLPSKIANPDIWKSSDNRLKDSSWYTVAGLASGIFGTSDVSSEQDINFLDNIKKLWRHIMQQIMP